MNLKHGIAALFHSQTTNIIISWLTYDPHFGSGYEWKGIF